MLVFIPLLLYAILYLPFFGVYPFHDGNTEFHFVYNFYQGTYLSHWMPFHPPAKLFLDSLFFYAFGLSTFSYTYVGFFFGIMGIIAMYLIAETIFDKRIALLSSFFLAASGIYISNAIFNINDFLVTVLLLLAFACYVRKKFLFYGIFASIAILTKESAIMFSISVLVVELFSEKKFRLSSFLPVVAFQGWLWFLHITGHTLWNDWNFSSVAAKGSAYTLVDNVISLKILNQYAYENWRHLFIFNFNWVFWILVCVGFIKSSPSIRKVSQPILIILIFFALYSFIILSFQTFTITRYILPLLPFLYLFAAFGLDKISYNYFLLSFVCIILFISLFSSVDPISNHIWSKTRRLNQEFYLGPLDGPDSITYNMQYLELAKSKDKIIFSGNCTAYFSDLDYDPRTFAIFNTLGCR